MIKQKKTIGLLFSKNFGSKICGYAERYCIFGFKFIILTLPSLVEKVILLENISLIDFLGVENKNIKAVAQKFPQCKIISRGNELRLKGSSPEIIKINEIINSLLEHYRRFGKLTLDDTEAYLNNEANVLRDSENDTILYGVKGLVIKPKTHNQKLLADAILKNDLVFAVGPAGTGKTYIATAMAVRALKNKQVRRIIITRPAVEAGESLGFLPGDMQDKVDPYLRPIYDALDDMIPSEKLKYYREKNIIEIAPLAYMRGRTLSEAFILLDEAQNTTTMQMKMMLTRLGQNSKMIITGDQSQIDLPRNQKSGLTEAVRILKNVQGISVLFLDGKDVIRHRLVKRIISAYEKISDVVKAKNEKQK